MLHSTTSGDSLKKLSIVRLSYAYFLLPLLARLGAWLEWLEEQI